jgi:ureidoglycolate hydrolase
MGSDIVVKPQILDGKRFANYGQVVSAQPDQAPDNQGDGWVCWYPLATLAGSTPLQIGLVRSAGIQPAIAAMERHLDRAEWVYALDRPVLQAVALSSPAAPDQPDANQAAVFVLQPGQGVLLRAGVWHAPGMSADGQAAQYGFVLGRPSAPGQDSGWVKFTDAAVLQVQGR